MKVERIIILEGPNGFGKTTTAKNLYKLHNIPYIHFPLIKIYPDNPSMYIKEMLYVMDQIESGQWFNEPINSKVIVFDRFFLSTLLYNTVNSEFVNELFKQWKDLYHFVVGVGEMYTEDKIKIGLSGYNYKIVKSPDEMYKVAEKKVLEMIKQ